MRLKPLLVGLLSSQLKQIAINIEKWVAPEPGAEKMITVS